MKGIAEKLNWKDGESVCKIREEMCDWDSLINISLKLYEWKKNI